MDWVKRNLVFVIGSVVALGLLVFSGFFLISNWKKNDTARAEIERQYAELRRLSNLNPHPGNGKVDNIKIAREQRKELLGLMKQVAARFEPIAAVPPSAQVTGEEFSAAMRRTMDQLQRQAANSSVILPPKYSFSFEAEKPLVRFAPGSLNRLAAQLGEIRAICDILFDAKINSLENLRRERVSDDDYKGPQTDYLSSTSVTNDLAVIAPYEVSFRSFSTELARVVAGFANSPHGMIIRAINVEPASATPAAGAGLYGSTTAPGAAQPVYPNYRAATPNYGTETDNPYNIRRPTFNNAAAYGGRYGGPEGEYGGAGGAGGIRRPTFQRPTFENNAVTPARPAYNYPNYARPGVTPGAVPQTQSGSQTLVDEQPLSITMIIEVIKLAPLTTTQD